MEDARNVCCMCGDIGFPEKLFQCLRCVYRFQHSYCSNYYREESSTAGVCDWCKSEEHRTHTRRIASSGAGDKAGRQGGDRDEGSAGGSRGRSSGAGPPSSSSSSAKQSGRRYKLLKDVLC
ncbi:hypothetical protein IEQ34_014338 [Dendrobium chrysotoxum]|uniref:PHD-type zinc finger plants domain-containing protein n=1 Tax=Dendrobium chrysotoxum TaxID=161865 RepID=A0AAV7GIZ2_DENCH|nr:hypothetical protein IEQ34_014338 [Dendrobium chrysotoxum]